MCFRHDASTVDFRSCNACVAVVKSASQSLDSVYIYTSTEDGVKMILRSISSYFMLADVELLY